VTAAHGTLRKLAVRDEAFIDDVMVDHVSNRSVSALDAKTHALVQLGALITDGAESPSYAYCVHNARAAGATDDEIVGTLIAVLPPVGIALVVKAAPRLALAVGYDVDQALEWAADDGHG
jgi:4-carboxymuconolactone decarboxylase